MGVVTRVVGVVTRVVGVVTRVVSGLSGGITIMNLVTRRTVSRTLLCCVRRALSSRMSGMKDVYRKIQARRATVGSGIIISCHTLTSCRQLVLSLWQST